jgi:hypothetical protein
VDAALFENVKEMLPRDHWFAHALAQTLESETIQTLTVRLVLLETCKDAGQ